MFKSPRVRVGILIVTVMLLGSALACGSLLGGGGGGGGSGATVTLVNNSSQTVCFVYISPVEDQYWGDDWLGALETISPGSSRTFNVNPGQYDLLASDCDDNQIDVEWGVTISGDHTWTLR